MTLIGVGRNPDKIHSGRQGCFFLTKINLCYITLNTFQTNFKSPKVVHPLLKNVDKMWITFFVSGVVGNTFVLIFVSLNQTNFIMKKTPIPITQTELINILNGIERPTFTHIVSETIVKMNKGKTKEGGNELNPYYNKVTKLRRGKFLIGSDYESRVVGNDKKEGGEGNFKSQESKVGVHISKCVLFNEEKNTYYLSHERFPEVKPQSEYLFEGSTIDKVLFDKWISDTNNYGNQPQERKVEWTTLKINNIKEISLNGSVYKIEG